MAGRVLEAEDELTWAHLDDRFPDHPANEALSDGAFRLHIAAICYCARLETDGHMPAHQPRRLTHTFKPKHVNEMLEGGRWHTEGHDCSECPQPRDPGGFYVHGFLGPNESKAQADKRRTEAAERKARWVEKKRREAEAKKNAAGTQDGTRSEPVAEQDPIPARPGLPPTEAGPRAPGWEPLPPERVAENHAAVASIRAGLRAVR